MPPVTALRSPPDSRITGADSPVIADSSTEAMPSITVPSPGITLAGLDHHDVAALQLGGGLRRSRRAACATVSVRIARSASACALPRPSASASAQVREDDGQPQPDRDGEREPGGLGAAAEGLPPKSWISQATVVITAPISTTNMTGLRTCTRGSSLAKRADQRRAQDVAA